MMLWICNQCGEHFEAPNESRTHGEDHDIITLVCPHCHSEDIDQYWDTPKEDQHASAHQMRQLSRGV